MIEESFLPDWGVTLCFRLDAFARPFFPAHYEMRKFFGGPFGMTKEMNVIGHNDVLADHPAVALACVAPFVDENVCDDFVIKNLASFLNARSDEINWRFNPNPRQPFQLRASGHPWF